jgi:hypothetical protein
LKVNRRFGETFRLKLQGRKISGTRNQRDSRWQAETCFPPAFTLVSFLAYSSTLKFEAKCFSETSFGLQRTTRRYIPEEITLHNHRCDSLKSCKEVILALGFYLIKGMAPKVCGPSVFLTKAQKIWICNNKFLDIEEQYNYNKVR